MRWTPSSHVQQTFIQYHVTARDLSARSSTTAPPIPIPLRTSSRFPRKGGPNTCQEIRAGGFSFETTPGLVRASREEERARRRSRHSCNSNNFREPRPLRKEVLEQLPVEIYQCILTQLEGLHRSRTALDIVGLEHDLLDLCLTSRHWCRAARKHLYGEIWLPSSTTPGKRRYSLFSRAKSKLHLLLRTLSETPRLASLVQHLCIRSVLAGELDEAAVSWKKSAASWGTIAGIIRRCPNLEDLGGYIPPLPTVAAAGLTTALAKCPQLRAHAWTLRADRPKNDVPTSIPRDFVNIHTGWLNLETLIIHSDGRQPLGSGVLLAVLERLPSLQHLMLSGLPSSDIHDATLTTLPRLKSLRLENLPGVTDQGIAQLAITRLIWSLQSLTLIDLNLTHFRTVQLLWDTLSTLRHFTFQQNTPPHPPAARAGGATYTTASGSLTLQSLHWDVLLPSPATTLLAQSIAAGHFPRLQRIRAPCDPAGTLQALCRPIAMLQRSPKPTNLTTPTVSTLPDFSGPGMGKNEAVLRDLRVSRLRAQQRVRSSRRQPSLSITITAEDDEVQRTHVIGSYLGSMASRIEYDLEPDLEGSVQAVARFADVRAPPRSREEDGMVVDRGVGMGGERDVDLRILFGR